MPVKTTITGVIQGPSGDVATSGYVTFRLMPGGSSQPYRVSGTSIIAPIEVNAVINSSGQIKATDGVSALEIWGNDLLQPANSSYQLSYAPEDVVQQVVNGYLISGATYDLSDPVFQPELSINPASVSLKGELIDGNLIPLSGDVFSVGSSTKKYSEGHFAQLYADNVNLANPISADSIALAGYLEANLPTPNQAGRLARVTNNAGGTWHNSGVQWIKDLPHINVMDAPFNARNDGSLATDTTNALMDAFDAAMALPGDRAVIVMPPGEYAINSDLLYSILGVTPKALLVNAYGATLVPTSAVDIALTLSTSQNSEGHANTIKLAGLKIDGTATIGKKGILVGENVGNLSGAITIEDVSVLHFDGLNSMGMDVRNIVNLDCRRLYLGRNGTNLYIYGTAVGGDLPTTLLFDNCRFREAQYAVGGGTGRGLDLVRGYRVRFINNCLFEANDKEGIYCAPQDVADNVLWAEFDGCWVEANHQHASSGAGDYDTVFDGSAAGTVMVRMSHVNYNSTYKSHRMASVVNAILEDFYPKNAAASVLIDTGCVGNILSWPENNVPYATVVTNNSPLTMAARSDAPAVFWNTLRAVSQATFQDIVDIVNIIRGANGANLDLMLRIGANAAGFGRLQDHGSVDRFTWTATGVALNTRIAQALGGNFVAGNDVTLPTAGNVFTSTGNTTINRFATSGWQAGPFIVVFSGTPQLTHGVAGGGGFFGLALPGSVNTAVVAGDMWMFVNDGAVWQASKLKAA